MSEVPLEVCLIRVGQLSRVDLWGVRQNFISHKVFIKLFCDSQFPHKSVNLFLILVIVKD